MGQCYHSAAVVRKCGTKVSTDNSFAPHSISVESCIDRRQTYGVWDGRNTNDHHKPMHDHIIMVSVPHLLSVVQPPLDTAKSKAAKQGRFPRCSPRIDEQLSQNQPNRVCSFLNSWNFPEHDPGSRTPSHSTPARGLLCTDGLNKPTPWNNAVYYQSSPSCCHPSSPRSCATELRHQPDTNSISSTRGWRINPVVLGIYLTRKSLDG